MIKRIIVTLVLGVSLIFVSGCTRPSDTTRILTQQGYTDINITGYRFFRCSDGDFFHTGFEATTPTGSDITGTCCQGMFFKNSTIRFD